jgi:RNA polymerase sigma factor (sigma-70 family)
MPNAGLSATVSRARQAVLRSGLDTCPDGRLLSAFLADRDADAFAELVARFGPMVFAVCRRVTGHRQDAEDAFQATFVVLARKAAAVSPREAVGSWLYGVAVRTALEARTVAAKRLARETPTARLSAVARPEQEPDDLEVLLHEELAELPEKFRTLLVLCDLRGEPQTDVAQRLGLPAGTVYSRLAKARSLLAGRLRQRGVVLSAAGLTTALAGSGQAAVPAGLPPKAVSAALTPDSASAAVAALSNGVFRTMLLQKLVVGAACGLLLAAACLAVQLAVPNALANDPPKPPVLLVVQDKPGDDKKPPPAPKPAGPGTLLLAREGGLVALTPEGKEGDELSPPKDARSTFQGRLSPDGTHAAFVVNRGKPRGPGDNLDDPWPFQVIISKLGAAEPTASADFSTKGFFSLCWAPDGKKVLVTNDTVGDGTLERVLVDAASGKTEPIELPAGVRVLDWSRDGKTFLVIYRKDKSYRLGLAGKGDQEARELTELKVRFGSIVARFSPDGKKVLFTDADPEKKDAFKWHRSSLPHVLDVATKKREPLADFPEDAQCLGLAWSPDGKRVAYTWVQLHPDLLKKDMLNIADEKETEAFLIVADADGKNQKVVKSAKIGNTANSIFGSIDWR